MSNLPPLFRPLAKYATFDGRSNRAEFWMFIGVVYLLKIAIVLLILNPAFPNGDYAHPDWQALTTSYISYSPFLSLFGLIMLLPSLAVFVRRLHDINKSGWWLLAPIGVGFIAYFVFIFVKGDEFMKLALDFAQTMPKPQPGVVPNPMEILKLEIPMIKLILPWIMIPTYAADLLLLIVCALPGTQGANRFGAQPPKG